MAASRGPDVHRIRTGARFFASAAAGHERSNGSCTETYNSLEGTRSDRFSGLVLGGIFWGTITIFRRAVRIEAASSVCSAREDASPNRFGPQHGTTPATSTYGSKVATAHSQRRRSISACRRQADRARRSRSIRSVLPTIAGTPRSAPAVILTDSSRLVPTPGLATSLRTWTGATNGIVLDVTRAPRIHALNAQADANAACPFAKNLVAEAIRDVVNSFRDTNGTLKYVVIAGGDSVIPFFRYADSSGLGPESDFVPPASDPTASQASLRRNYVLGQDAYGAKSDLTIKGSVLPVPDLAVGRLVETQDEIAGMIDTFLALPSGNLPRPTSSLVTGYDFLTSAADSVQTDFAAGLGTDRASRHLDHGPGRADDDDDSGHPES